MCLMGTEIATKGNKSNIKKWRSLSGSCRFPLKTKTSSPDSKTLSAVNHVKLIIYLKNRLSLYSGSHLQEMHELPWVKN